MKKKILCCTFVLVISIGVMVNASITNNYALSISQNNLTENETAEVEEITKTFNTKEEAEAYLASLENEGYTITESSITQDSHESVVTLNQTFDTKEEAETALTNFESTYDNVNGTITKKRNESKDTKESTLGTNPYNAKEEAENAATALEKDTDEQTITASVREESKTVRTDEKHIDSDQFDTELDAINYIKQLENEGYFVDQLETILLTFEESTWTNQDGVVINPGDQDSQTFNYGHFDVTVLNHFTNIDQNGNESTVTGTLTVNSVTINGNNVAMTGPSTDPNSGLREYTSIARYGLNVNNKSYVVIKGTVVVDGKSLPYTVEGYLSESQNVCEGRGNSKGFDLQFKSVTIIQEKVLVDTTLVSKYKVTGDVYKLVEQKTYYVDQEKTTKGYDYELIAEGTEIVLDDIYTLKAKIYKTNEEVEEPVNITVETKNNDTITPPKTGI